MKKVIIIFLSWLIVVNVFGLLGLNRFNLKGDTAYTWIEPNVYSQNQNWNLVNLHAQWDSFWYLDIAEHGYQYEKDHPMSNIAFFPLYPLLIYLVSLATFGNLLIAGWIISLLFLLFALIYFHKLLREFHPNLDPYLPLILLLIFPTAFFLNVIYTESLFIFLSIASFYYARKKNFLVASFFGLLAALTRITGILLFLPLLWEYVLTANYYIKNILRPKILSLVLIPLGTASLFLFHYFKFGDVLLWFKVEASWGRAFKINGDHFILSTNPAIVNFAIDVLFVSTAILLTYLVWKRVRSSYGIYMATTLLVALSTGTMMSIGRYILPLFPLYIYIAQVKNENIKLIWVFTSILLLAMNITLFVNGYWAG